MLKMILFLVAVISIFAACQTEVKNAGGVVTNAPPIAFQEISPAAAKNAVETGEAQFIDVRTADEYAGGHAPKAANFPLDTLEKRLAELDRDKPVYVICETGRRSAEGAKILNQAGFKDVYSVTGGTSGWRSAGLPLEK